MTVIEIAEYPDYMYVRGVSDGIYVSTKLIKGEKSRAIEFGDTLWSHNGRIYWTPGFGIVSGRCGVDYDILLEGFYGHG